MLPGTLYTFESEEERLFNYLLAEVVIYMEKRYIGKCQLEIQFPVWAACWLQRNLCQTCT